MINTGYVTFTTEISNRYHVINTDVSIQTGQVESGWLRITVAMLSLTRLTCANKLTLAFRRQPGYTLCVGINKPSGRQLCSHLTAASTERVFDIFMS